MIRFAKQTGAAMVLVGHVTKEGQIAGPQVMTEDGDIGTVEAGGTISSTGPNAVAVTGDDAYVANYGNIFGNGAFADGIDVSGDRAVIDNFGVVRTYDAYADAISVTGADAVVTNRGFIYAVAHIRGGKDKAKTTRVLNRQT